MMGDEVKLGGGITLSAATPIKCAMKLIRNGMRVLTHCNAGHNPPLVIGNGSLRRLSRGGLIVGAFETRFEEETLQLNPGDTIVVYSDGVTESRAGDGSFFELERLQPLIERHGHVAPRILLQSIVDELTTFSGGADQAGSEASISPPALQRAAARFSGEEFARKFLELLADPVREVACS